jgi:hypothetical protein
MIFSRSDPRPVVMTWITVCIQLGSTGNHLFCTVCLFSRLAVSKRYGVVMKSDRRLDVSNSGLLACTQIRLSASRQQRAVHNINIHVSVFGMTKGTWQSANDLEPELLPQTDRRFVGRDNKIELHRPKTEAAGFT